jgi:hypothetical protein
MDRLGSHVTKRYQHSPAGSDGIFADYNLLLPRLTVTQPHITSLNARLSSTIADNIASLQPNGKSFT